MGEINKAARHAIRYFQGLLTDDDDIEKLEDAQPANTWVEIFLIWLVFSTTIGAVATLAILSFLVRHAP